MIFFFGRWGGWVGNEEQQTVDKHNVGKTCNIWDSRYGIFYMINKLAWFRWKPKGKGIIYKESKSKTLIDNSDNANLGFKDTKQI